MLYKKPPLDQRRIDLNNERELTLLQYKYRKTAEAPIKQTKQKIYEKNVLKWIEQLTHEKKDVQAKLKAATGKTHITQYEHHMEALGRHNEYQDAIQLHIRNVKTEIDHLNGQMKRIGAEHLSQKQLMKNDYDLNTRLKKSQHEYDNLEKRLDVLKKRECSFVIENKKLREVINHMIYGRQQFHDQFNKSIRKLSYNERYLFDLNERAMLAFDQGTELCNNIRALQWTAIRDKKMHVSEILEIIRNLHGEEKLHEFLMNKGTRRHLAALEEREVRRRNDIKKNRREIIDTYTKVLKSVHQFMDQKDINKIIKKFDLQDHEYFAHFSYMESLNSKIEYLNSAAGYIISKIVDKTTNEITKTKEEQNEMKEIVTVFTSSRDKVYESAEINAKKADEIRTLLMKLQEIFYLLECDDAPLKRLLGDFSKISLQNVKKFLAIFEVRLLTIISVVYANERKDITDSDNEDDLTVKNVRREKHPLTDIVDVVQAQQCPECGMSEDVNKFDENIVYPLTRDEVRGKLIYRINKPDMQFRMHSISKCRLPKSRVLVTKRYK